MLNDEQTIARQAKIIFALHDKVDILKSCLSEIQSELVCIGGPLNDNNLHFTKPQLLMCQRILDHTDVIREKDL